jgi:hypothetical protein
MKLEGPLACSQELATGTYSQPDDSISNHTALFF